MKIAFIYTSKTGNTEELVKILHKLFRKQASTVDLYRITDFPLGQLSKYDAIVVGTYTWGDGELPPEMEPLYEAFESVNRKQIITGVVGTGDRFYPNFCGAVDAFRDMLYVHTDLTVTLKVELRPQTIDLNRCKRFVELFMKKCHAQYRNGSESCVNAR
ncbi:flavodoxin domain-containing protein [Neobacillus sp. SM06]|uniref:flavodoxin domain-containing protein n=1 Tax=Neobacillus sp. SM06 TaxID=3422492 RepID=UPI003D272FE9